MLVPPPAGTFQGGLDDDIFDSVDDIPEPRPGTPGIGLLDPGRFTMTQLLRVDLASGIATVPLHLIRQLAADGIVTNPGGSLRTSSNQVVNCPILGFRDEPPTEPQADRPPGVP